MPLPNSASFLIVGSRALFFAGIRGGGHSPNDLSTFKLLVTAWSFLRHILGGLGGISGLEKVEAQSDLCQFLQMMPLAILRASILWVLAQRLCPESMLKLSTQCTVWPRFETPSSSC